jgi:hypothetical protein
MFVYEICVKLYNYVHAGSHYSALKKLNCTVNLHEQMILEGQVDQEDPKNIIQEVRVCRNKVKEAL